MTTNMMFWLFWVIS